MNFTGRVAMITGAAGNLGRAVAGAFHDAGATVVLVDHAKSEPDRLPEAEDRRFHVVADLLDEASAMHAADAAMAKFGRIDILCNIAGGFSAGTPVHETPAVVWRRMFDLNAMTVVHTAKAVVPKMITARRGNIVNVAAASSVHGPPGMAAYVVAKNGVVRLTESMAAELRADGICVTCIMPTFIDTPQNRAAMPGADTSQWTPPRAIADAVLLLATDAAMIMSGASISIAGRDRDN